MKAVILRESNVSVLRYVQPHKKASTACPIFHLARAGAQDDKRLHLPAPPLHQIMFLCLFRQVYEVLDIHFTHEVEAMGLYGAFAIMQFFGNLPVGQS